MTDVNVISKELNPSISKKVNEANAEAADENTS
jgi:hypothetical protein